ncbi:DUF11 domain-containing protein [Thermobrachium celere]|uniref:DUF11 domain-containing protein n=1 Tax=Thermobrachium celere DSM 8682 TaxID=941824 RepID=R7RMS3_9CLOT|nr:DUF11 domain-containing protein [Thermobrachium celere]CDF57354.1 hypothetical protein TCEL_01268 [Thermobrachium celere DSM 8682]
MRLNQTPLKNVQGDFKEFGWGVYINFGINLKYTVTVDTSGGNYRLIVTNPFGVIIYNQPVVLGNNVRVIKANTTFPCGKTPDDDFFLDFKVPIFAFEGFNFDTTVFSLCYFTSTQNQVLIKDIICGDEINALKPTVVTIEKQIIQGPLTVDVNQTATWTVRITVTNTTAVDSINTIVVDTINNEIAGQITGNISFNLTQGTATYSAPKVTWNVGTLLGNSSAILQITFTASFSTSGQKILDSATVVSDNSIISLPVQDEGVLVKQTGVPFFTLKKDVEGPLEVNVEEQGTWTVTLKVENPSQVTVNDIVVEDNLHPELNVTSVSPDPLNPSKGSASITGNKITWNVGNLSPSEEATLTFDVTGHFNAAGSKVFNIAYGRSSNAQEVGPVDDTTIVVKLVTPTVTITKVVDEGPISPEVIKPEEENSWKYTLRVKNLGEGTAKNLVVTDVINYELYGSATITWDAPTHGSVDFNEDTFILKWTIGNLDEEDEATLTVYITNGVFMVPGYKVLNYAKVDGDNVLPVGPVYDIGVLVATEYGILKIDKEVLSGPTQINACTKGNWRVKITVENISSVKLYCVKLVDVVNEYFVFINGIQNYTTNAGNIFFDSISNKFVWDIGNMEPGQRVEFEINFKGYFIQIGQQSFDTAVASAKNAVTVEARDEGVLVKAAFEDFDINIEGNIIDCKTGELIDNVTVKVYKDCSLITTVVADYKYSFNLKVGTYTIVFEKEGYYKKFVAPIIFTDEYIRYDVKLLKKEAIDANFEENMDIYAEKITERIDGNIVLNQIVCLHEKYNLECGSDVIDKFEYRIIKGRLILKFLIEKNVIYKLEGKDLMINLIEHTICYPLQTDVCDKEFKYKYKVNRFKMCRDLSKLYNFCDIEFKGFFVEPMDILIEGKEE